MNKEKIEPKAVAKLSHSLEKQKGFAIGLILGVLGLIGLIATAITLSVSNSSANTDIQKNQSNAAVIIEQSNNLALTASFMIAQGSSASSANVMTVNNSATTGLYGKGGLGKMNPQGIGGVTSISWGNSLSADLLYADRSFAGSIANDYYIAVDGVQAAVCNEINNTLNLNNVSVLTTVDNPLEADFTNKGFQAGCFLTATGAATGKFYRVIQAN